MNVANRISMILAIALLSLLGVGSYALWGLSAAQDRFEYVQDNSIPSVQTLQDANSNLQRIRISLRDYILAGDSKEERDAQANVISEARQTIEKDLARYEKELLSDDTDKQMVMVDKGDSAKFIATVQEVISKTNANEAAAAHAMLSSTGEFSAIAKQLTKDFSDHVAYNWKLADDLRRANAAAYAQSKWIQVFVMLLAVVLVGVLGYVVINEIRSRMNRLKGFIEQVNQNLDFTQRIKITRLDELGAAADAFNKLIERLQENLKEISAGAYSVAFSATQMATTSSQVATASHQQSEAAAGMAATVEQMTVSINHVADRAQEANGLSSESGRLAISGETIIAQTVGDIQNIAVKVNAATEIVQGLESHSQKISVVVQVIKEVAEQTNLLALNAAIEAARAGEQGRGFAVVADEVRKLAERTASSTQEITGTIETMRNGASKAVLSMREVVDNVARGVAHVEEANVSIKQIGESSRSAVVMVEEIAAAIREQGAATNNIATQVERIAQMSEESSAAAGNSSQSAKDLDQLAAEMQKVVAAYRL